MTPPRDQQDDREEAKQKENREGIFALSDAELARRCRMAEVPTFLRMVELLGNDLKAARAMREESKYMLAHPETPQSQLFATRVRQWLIEKNLEWTQENLEKAVGAIL